MTALDKAQMSADRVIDSVSGVGGVLTAPLSSSRSTLSELESLSQNTIGIVFDSLLIVPSSAVLYLLLVGPEEKSTARRLGEGLSLGVVVGFLAYFIRGGL